MGILKQLLDSTLGRIRRTRVAPKQRAGTFGTAIYGGYISDVESSSDLSGTEKYTVFSDMLVNVSIVAAGLRYFLNLVSNPEWTLEPPEDSGDEGQDIADKLAPAIFEMTTPWRRVVRRAAMYRFHGFSWQEWTAKQMEDGTIGFLDIEPRSQKTIEKWDVDINGEVVGVVQRSPQNGQEYYIPRGKSVYLVDDSLNDSPEGVGLFRHMVEPSRVLRRYEQLEGWGFELDCRGMPVGRGPLQEIQDDPDLSDAQKSALIASLKDFIENHVQDPKRGLMLDSMTYQTQDEKGSPSNVYKWNMELLKAGSTNLGDLNASIQRKTRELARVMGVETLLLGESGSGSLAMARDKSNNFALTVDATLSDLAEAFEKDIIEPLMKLNGWPMELKPCLKTQKIQHNNITDITDALASMAQAGSVLDPDDPAINAVRDLLGIPRRSEEAMLQDAVDASLDEMGPPPVEEEQVDEDEVPETDEERAEDEKA
jgi:hypothetical protein